MAFVLRSLAAGAVAVVVACVPAPAPTGGVEGSFPTLPAGARVELEDVAVAWPLPPGTGASEGFVGPLLSCDVISVFEPLTRTDEPADLCTSLVVTAARLDACVNEGTDTCRAELRLSLQPVFDGQARDAALHAFYDVDEEPVLVAIAQLMDLRLQRDDDGRRPLAVHSVLADDEGRRAVAAIFERLIDKASLNHVTQITVHGGNAAWTFESRFFTDGLPAEGDAKLQHLLSASEAVIDISVDPPSGSEDQFELLLKDDVAAAASLEEQQAAFDRAARVEHPDLHTMNTLDCATCHAAAPARAAALARAPLSASPDAFTSERHDLTPSAVFSNPQFIHAFAYRFDTLTINQRLVNEAAVSADVADARLTEEGVLK